jgi:hypothetical protein
MQKTSHFFAGRSKKSAGTCAPKILAQSFCDEKKKARCFSLSDETSLLHWAEEALIYPDNATQ